MTTAQELATLNQEIVSCRMCPRLVRYRESVARKKRRAFRDWSYWGRPVPSFGDPQAELVIIGLAPAAHGANRTGRMFTGDRSGEFLYRGLYACGLANQPTSTRREDGLALRNAYITATLRCAPPGNKPLPGEIANCRPYLEKELGLLRPRAVLALGRIAFDGYLGLLKDRGLIASRAPYPFSHGASFPLPGGTRLFASYHPSQQNTQTGRLTPAQFSRVLEGILRFLVGEFEKPRHFRSRRTCASM
jgi:uracil-DNA glycosylase